MGGAPSCLVGRVLIAGKGWGSTKTTSSKLQARQSGKDEKTEFETTDTREEPRTEAQLMGGKRLDAVVV